jgi:hypothetical protein
LAEVVGAFGSGELLQAFVGRQSFADEPVSPTSPSGRDSRPTREFPYSRYENALTGRFIAHELSEEAAGRLLESMDEWAIRSGRRFRGDLYTHEAGAGGQTLGK